MTTQVRIEVSQERTVEESPSFRVRTWVTYADGIDRNIFVHNRETGEFSHVAFTYDMNTYPSEAGYDPQNPTDYVRKEEASVVYTDENAAVAAAAYTLGRVRMLTDEYQVATTEFEGTDSHVYVNGEPV